MDDLPFDRVFADHNGAEESFAGFLLVNHGKQALADERMLAWAYAQTTLQSIDFALDNLDTPEAAYPALFMARHTLELFLKGLVPDWEEKRKKGVNRHSIDYLVEILTADLRGNYDDLEVAALSKFLTQISMIDPKSMAFRFQDGAIESFKDAPLDDPEIWVNFRTLKESLSMVFDGLDRIWAKRFHQSQG